VSTLEQYERIARFYDLLDLPFEHGRYRRLRPLLFRGLAGRLLDAGVGTGRNIPFYPPDAQVLGIDLSPSMLSRAEQRRRSTAGVVRLVQMDVTQLAFPDRFFDGAVAAFLFCTLSDELQVPALRELGRTVKPGGTIRLLEYVRPRGVIRRTITRVWEPWVRWAYGASFDRQTAEHVPEAGLELVDNQFVVSDLITLISARPR
jgi:ubiquinone/menaquinone biosynthesis C-methylase UbiE